MTRLSDHVRWHVGITNYDCNLNNTWGASWGAVFHTLDTNGVLWWTNCLSHFAAVVENLFVGHLYAHFRESDRSGYEMDPTTRLYVHAVKNIICMHSFPYRTKKERECVANRGAACVTTNWCKHGMERPQCT